LPLKDVISTKGIRTTGGLEDPRELRPVFDSTVGRALPAASMPVLERRTRTSSRWAPRPKLGLRPDAQSWDVTRVRVLGRGSAAAVSAGLRHGRSAPTRRVGQAAVGVLRKRWIAADVRHRLALRHRRVRASLDQVGPVSRHVRDNALLYRIISGLDENDSTTVDGRRLSSRTATT